MTTAPTTTPKPRLRWLQFSLRGLFIGILVLSLPLGWFAYKLREAREHRAAVKAIQTVGGRVGCYPDRLGRLPGEEVRGDRGDRLWVRLSRTPVRDAGLVYLRGLTTLYQLDLDATKVTDAGLVHLKGLTQLEELSLDSTQITDAGLEHLRGLTQLRTVDLRNTQVTDKGVNELQKALPNVSIER
jgi:hypothetical protein